MTANTSSGYLAFHSCARAPDAAAALRAAPIMSERRVIMDTLLGRMSGDLILSCVEDRNRRGGGFAFAERFLGFDAIEFARRCVGERRRRAVEHDPAPGHADQPVAVGAR